MAGRDGKILTEILLDVRDIKANLKAVRAEAQSTGSAFKKFFGGAQAAMSKFGLAISGVKQAASILAAPIRVLVRYGSAQVKVNEQLERVLKSTGNAAGTTSQEMRGLADALQQSTVYGNEEIQVAENLLLTFKKISGDTLPRTTQVVLDTAYAMDQGLKETSLQVGKALNDPIEGLTNLRRTGITFTEQQEAQIRAMVEVNDIAGAQTIILEELESQFGGSSEAIDNWWGAIQQAENAVGDLIEVIADRFGPVFKAAARFVKALSETLISWIEVPVSEKLREEKAEFNRLMRGIMDTNVQQEHRNGLVKELQDKYSDYLTNIDLEKSSTQELAEALKAANFQFDQRIRFHAMQELAGEKYKEMMAGMTAAEDLRMDALDARAFAEEAAALKVAGAAEFMGASVADSQKRAALEYLSSMGALAFHVDAYEDGMGRVTLTTAEVNKMLDDYGIQMTTIAERAETEADRQVAAVDAIRERWQKLQDMMSLMVVPENAPAEKKGGREVEGGAPAMPIPPADVIQEELDDSLDSYFEYTQLLQTEQQITADNMWQMWSDYLDGAEARTAQLRDFYRNTLEDMVIGMAVHGDSLKDIWGGVRDSLIAGTLKAAMQELAIYAGVEKTKTLLTAKGTTTRLALKSKEIMADMWGMIVAIGKGFASLGPWALLAIPAAIAGVLLVLKGFMSAAKSIKFFGEGGFVNTPQLAVVGDKPEVIAPMKVLDAAFQKYLGGGAGGDPAVLTELRTIATILKARRTIASNGALVEVYDGIAADKMRAAL